MRGYSGRTEVGASPKYIFDLKSDASRLPRLASILFVVFKELSRMVLF